MAAPRWVGSVWAGPRRTRLGRSVHPQAGRRARQTHGPWCRGSSGARRATEDPKHQGGAEPTTGCTGSARDGPLTSRGRPGSLAGGSADLFDPLKRPISPPWTSKGEGPGLSSVLLSRGRVHWRPGPQGPQDQGLALRRRMEPTPRVGRTPSDVLSAGQRLSSQWGYHRPRENLTRTSTPYPYNSLLESVVGVPLVPGATRSDQGLERTRRPPYRLDLGPEWWESILS